MKRFFNQIIPVLVALLAWEIVSRAEVVNPRLFPAPSLVLKASREWFLAGDLWRDVKSSYWRMLVGFGLGSFAGIGLGLLTGRIPWARASLTPVLQLLRPLPPVAIIPLIIVWLGIGETAKVFSISFAVLFPVWINTHIGSISVPREYLWSAKILGASRWRLWGQVLIPAALPSIIAGLRTSIAIAFIMVYVSEIAGASSGIGYRISVTHLAYRIDIMMAALVVLALAGALADFLFSRLMALVFPWLELHDEE